MSHRKKVGNEEGKWKKGERGGGRVNGDGNGKGGSFIPGTGVLPVAVVGAFVAAVAFVAYVAVVRNCIVARFLLRYGQ